MSDDPKLVNLNFGAPTPAVEDEPYFPPYDWKTDPLLEGRDAPPGEKAKSPDVHMYVRCACGWLLTISMVGGLATKCGRPGCGKTYSFTPRPLKPVRATLKRRKEQP